MSLDFSIIAINLVIAIPTFFILRWVLRKSIPSDKPLRKVLTWAGTIIFTPAIFFGLILLYVAYSTYYPERDFNELVWRTDKEKRYEMTKDLIKSEILIGKTKEDVQKILGDDFFKYDEEHWAYDVGFVPV
jgi:hypothetical protein